MNVRIGSTALHFAARNGWHHVVEVLLRYGASMHAQDEVNTRGSVLLFAAALLLFKHCFGIGTWLLLVTLAILDS